MEDRVGDRRSRTDIAKLANALDAGRVHPIVLDDLVQWRRTGIPEASTPTFTISVIAESAVLERLAQLAFGPLQHMQPTLAELLSMHGNSFRVHSVGPRRAMMIVPV